jgi:hypothetical protein
VVPYADNSELEKFLRPRRAYLQTVISDLTYESNPDLIRLLVEAGVNQFFKPGAGLPQNFGFPHEGEFQMRRLVKWVGLSR